MNPNTGEIRMVEGPLKLEGFTQLPQQLRQDATDLLGGRASAFVDLKSNTPLAKWAARKRRNKRKAVKQSRKANRGKKA